jgi:hypothetical protein
MNHLFQLASEFLYSNARLLERRIFDWRFQGGAPEPVVAALSAYQQQDGGFGQALEPDLRAPGSQPLFVEFALHALYFHHLRAAALAGPACDFLARHASLQEGIATRFASSNDYPRAAHWHAPHSEQPSFERLTSLVGLAAWQGLAHPWLEAAVKVCLEDIAARRYDDAHTIHNAFVLLESLSPQGVYLNAPLFEKLAGELFEAAYFVLEAPVDRYGLTPLDFAPAPASFCSSLFSPAQLEAHLDDLQARQQPDGGWPIRWEPPSEAARCEWRAIKTLEALVILRAYGRI